ncbi:hypothetical protein FACS1894187_17360 [Synergistales bacterium]|nr:hypothetical protein FACS1894187_17360 [Synergistales bacterium]
MWRNIRITSKLLLGFGLLLFVFIIAVGMTWRDIRNTNQSSTFLSSVVIPAISTNTDYERSIYEVFMATKDLQAYEDEASIKSVSEHLAASIKIMDDISNISKQHPTLASSRFIVETIAPIAKQYTDLINKSIDSIRKKRDAYAALVRLGNDMVKIVLDNNSNIRDILGGSIGTADNERMTYLIALLNDAGKMQADLANVRLAIQRGIANREINSLRDATTILAEIKKSAQTMLDSSKTPEQTARNSSMLKTLNEYETNVTGYVDAFVQAENIATERYKLRDAMNEATTKGSGMGFERTKSISNQSVKDLSASINLLLSSAGIAIILGVLIALFISRSIAKPLGVIVDLADRAGQGDLTIERADFKYEGKDELANLADALYKMISAQESSMHDVVEVAESLVDGAQNLSGISEESNAAMEEIKASIDQVSSLSESNGAALEECNAGVEEMSAGADTVAQSATDSAAFISQTTDGANKAADMVNNTTKGMRNVETNSKESEAKIRQLVDSVQNVSGFVSVITGIADQTNLLALNAAIEAARAGEVGRGFAVVAEEVRKLAEESAKAAQNVNGIISELQSGAQGSINATVEAGKVLTETLVQAEQAQEELGGAISEINKANDSIQNIAAVAEEQAASSREIATGIDKATKSTMEMVNTVSSIRGAVDNTAKAAQSVAEQAEAITQHSEKLSGVLSRFKLRAAGVKEIKGAPAKALKKPAKRL